jgi:hypothetical protein
MSLIIFHQDSRRIFRGEYAIAPAFEHRIGGAADYVGLTAYEGQPAVHVLSRLDTTDPTVGVMISSARWLPLLCAIRYGACDLGYRVISDSAVQILCQREKKEWDGFSYDGYPTTLPEETVALRETPYDPSNPTHALCYAGVFGYEALTPQQYADLTRHVMNERLFVPGIMDFNTPEEFLQENGWPFAQGRPVDDCPNASCPNHGRASSLRHFAIFQEDDSNKVRRLWGPNCDSLQVIYQICPACQAIRTCNQCA